MPVGAVVLRELKGGWLVGSWKTISVRVWKNYRVSISGAKQRCLYL